MNDNKRQEIIADIDSGKYLQDDPKSVSRTIVMTTMLILAGILMGLFGIMQILSYNFTPSLTIVLVIIFAVSATLIIRSVSKTGIYGKLSNADRRLIQSGDMLEADIVSVEYNETSRSYFVHCSAEYKGQKYNFKSMELQTSPLKKEGKITVFVNPQNPNKYFMNFYSIMPVVRNNQIGISGEYKKGVIEDRSELRNKPVDVDSKQTEMQAGGKFVADMVNKLFAKQIQEAMDILRKGDYVEADAYETYHVSGDHDITYCLKLRYTEPNTKKTHEFEATSGNDVFKPLVGTKVNVYLNPDDTSKYLVDYSEALRNLGFTANGSNSDNPRDILELFEMGLLS
jgi:hypothetical protein